MIEAVTTRLEGRIAELQGRIEGAAELSRVMQSGALPGLAVYLLPLGLQGAAADAAAGMYRQSYRETLGVMLVMGSNDRAGERALKRLRTLIFEVVEALAGWQPGDELGVFELTRGALVNLRTGHVGYQIDFTIPDQLRIPT